MLCLAVLLCVCVAVLPPPAANQPFTNRESYSQSLILTRKIHRDVCSLLARYKEQQIGSKTFEDYSLLLSSLPTASMNYSYWLSMEDAERLQVNIRDLHVFRMHIEAKKLYEQEKEPQSSLIQALDMILLDIRDLFFQITHQLEALQAPSPVLSSIALPSKLLNPQFPWLSRLQGYIILRDLQNYLDKMVRDFTLLKTNEQQH